MAELVRLVVFLTLLGAVYVTAAVMLFVTIWRWILQLPAPSRKLVCCRRFILGVAGIGVACVAYGYFIEPYWPEVTRVRIESSKLSARSQPITLVHISDLHSDPNPRLEPQLSNLIAELHPDVILFTGDCTNAVQGVPIFKQCLTELAAIAPTFVVKGNWDIWRPNIDLFGGTGATELHGQKVELEIRGSRLCFAGAAAKANYQIESALADLPKNAISLFLYHYPEVIYDAAAARVDICCVGHTHGGQVALPFYGAIVTRSTLGKRFEWGLYRVQDTWLYVNRGIGMER